MYKKILSVVVLAFALALPATQANACPEGQTRCGTNLCC